MEQLHNQVIETENATIKPRLTWLDVLIGAALLILLGSATYLAQHPQRPQPTGLVVVTKYVCQPTPTVASVQPYYRTIP